jgi:hypothetical protein
MPSTSTCFCSSVTVWPATLDNNISKSSNICPYKNLILVDGLIGLASELECLSYHNCLVGLPIEDRDNFLFFLGCSFKTVLILLVTLLENCSKYLSKSFSFILFLILGSNKLYISSTNVSIVSQSRSDLLLN